MMYNVRSKINGADLYHGSRETLMQAVHLVNEIAMLYGGSIENLHIVKEQ